MEESTINDKLKTIVIETLKISASDYSDDLAAGDIPQWDSIGHVNLLMAVEQGFGVAFDVTDAIDIESVSDLQDMLRKYLSEKGS